jgi:WD40-like Beta Propeller Repeat
VTRPMHAHPWGVERECSVLQIGIAAPVGDSEPAIPNGSLQRDSYLVWPSQWRFHRGNGVANGCANIGRHGSDAPDPALSRAHESSQGQGHGGPRRNGAVRSFAGGQTTKGHEDGVGIIRLCLRGQWDTQPEDLLTVVKSNPGRVYTPLHCRITGVDERLRLLRLSEGGLGPQAIERDRAIAERLAAQRGARWSPDGKRIAFSTAFGRTRFGDGPQIWTVHPDGTHLRELTYPCMATCPGLRSGHRTAGASCSGAITRRSVEVKRTSGPFMLMGRASSS